jgi:hypothetical protein
MVFGFGRAWSFIVPAFIMMFVGIVMFLFLVVGESVVTHCQMMSD